MTHIRTFPGCTLATKAKSFDSCGAQPPPLLWARRWPSCPHGTAAGPTFPLATDNLMTLIAPTRILARAAARATTWSRCAPPATTSSRAPTSSWPPSRRSASASTPSPRSPTTAACASCTCSRCCVMRSASTPSSRRCSQPLTGQRLAAYYGCLLLRTGDGAASTTPRTRPSSRICCAALGAMSVDYSHKTECCGSYLVVSEPLLARELSYAIVAAAQRRKATALVTSCPLCQFNLESRQAEMAREHPASSRCRVVYFTELLAQALGMAGSRWQRYRSDTCHDSTLIAEMPDTPRTRLSRPRHRRRHRRHPGRAGHRQQRPSGRARRAPAVHRRAHGPAVRDVPHAGLLAVHPDAAHGRGRASRQHHGC